MPLRKRNNSIKNADGSINWDNVKVNTTKRSDSRVKLDMTPAYYRLMEEIDKKIARARAIQIAYHSNEDSWFYLSGIITACEELQEFINFENRD